MTDPVVRLEIRGVVQGVGFRWSMAEQARRGPDSATVDSVQLFDGAGNFDSFEQLPTA